MLESTRDTRRPTQPEEPPSGITVTPETRPGDSELAVEPPFEGTASDIPGRYVDLQPHVKGGLGEVYRGRDAELNRPAAVKRIQPRHADNSDARARFFYGLVQGPDGQPCYAMRFIQGESLNDAIAKYHDSGPSPSASEANGDPPRWLRPEAASGGSAGLARHSRQVSRQGRRARLTDRHGGGVRQARREGRQAHLQNRLRLEPGQRPGEGGCQAARRVRRQGVGSLEEDADRERQLVDSPAKLAAHMKKDRDLDPLREREDFKKLLAELEKKE